MNGNVCVEEQLLLVSEKEEQRVYCFARESRSHLSRGIFANSEGGVLNILPGTVPLLVQYS